MRKVLFEKYEPYPVLLRSVNEIKAKGKPTNDSILFLSKDLLIYKLNTDLKVKPNNKKAYIIPCSKIVGLCYVKAPTDYYAKIRWKTDCINSSHQMYLSEIDSNFARVNILYRDSTLNSYEPLSFIEENEEKIINLIFICNSFLKDTFKKMDFKNPLYTEDILKALKEYSNVYKFYRKKIVTKSIMDEKMRIAKESRLLSK